MSQSWTERVVLDIKPERVTALRFKRGWHPSLIGSESIATRPDLLSNKAAMVDAIAPLLSICNPARVPVDMVLSNHLVHYAVLPGDRTLTRDQQQQALARIVFDRQYGNLAQNWELQVSAGDSGDPLLACGIDRDLLAALRESIGTGIRLRSLRPVLMGIINQHRNVLETGSACLVIAEHGRITLAFVRKGLWQAVIGRSVDPVDSEAPARFFGEQLALLNHDRPGVTLLCNIDGVLPHLIHPEWTAQMLPRPETELAADDGLAGWGVR